MEQEKVISSKLIRWFMCEKRIKTRSRALPTDIAYVQIDGQTKTDRQLENEIIPFFGFFSVG